MIDQADFYEHLKIMEIGGTESASAQCIKDQDGTLLREAERFRARKVRFFDTLLLYST